VLSALPGAIVGIPLGIVLFKAVAGHQTGSPSALWVAIAALGTLLAVVGLTTIPALIGARIPAPQILQSETPDPARAMHGKQSLRDRPAQPAGPTAPHVPP